MKIVPVPRIAGALLFEPVPRRDERGFFCRTAEADVLREAGLDAAAFVQDSVSRSARGVVRGLHLRTCAAATARRSWCAAPPGRSST